MLKNNDMSVYMAVVTRLDICDNSAITRFLVMAYKLLL